MEKNLSLDLNFRSKDSLAIVASGELADGCSD